MSAITLELREGEAAKKQIHIPLTISIADNCLMLVAFLHCEVRLDFVYFGSRLLKKDYTAYHLLLFFKIVFVLLIFLVCLHRICCCSLQHLVFTHGLSPFGIAFFTAF